MLGFIQELDKANSVSSGPDVDILFSTEELRSQAQYISESSHLDNTKVGKAVIEGNKEDYLVSSEGN